MEVGIFNERRGRCLFLIALLAVVPIELSADTHDDTRNVLQATPPAPLDVEASGPPTLSVYETGIVSIRIVARATLLVRPTIAAPDDVAVTQLFVEPYVDLAPRQTATYTWSIEPTTGGPKRITVEVIGSGITVRRNVEVDVTYSARALLRHWLSVIRPLISISCITIVAALLVGATGARNRKLSASLVVAAWIVAIGPMILLRYVSLEISSSETVVSLISLLAATLVLALRTLMPSQLGGVIPWLRRVDRDDRSEQGHNRSVEAESVAASSDFLPETARELLDQFARRSSALSSDALRRAYIHLASGIAIGTVGLIFFFVSTASILPKAGDVGSTQTTMMLLVAALPRIGVLVFIEITAGFFLKQYAATMEEFRYFERVQRHREAELLSFVLRREAGQEMGEFAAAVLGGAAADILKSGETTATLEAQRAAVNDVENLLSKALDSIRDVIPKL